MAIKVIAQLREVKLGKIYIPITEKKFAATPI